VFTKLPVQAALYGDMAVLPELDEWARDAFTADGVPAAGIVVTGGVLDGTERALSAHLRPGDRVAVEDPAHCGLLDLLAILRFDPVPVLADEAGMLPEGLARTLAAGAKAVVVTPRMQNPTASALTARRATELGEVLSGHPDVLLVENDHAALLSEVPLHTLTTHAGSWVAMRSMSKALGPDLRLAVLAADPRTLARIAKRQAATGWVSHLLQRLVATLLADPGTGRLLDTARTRYRERRAALVAALTARGVASAPGSGYNVWIPLPGESTVVQGLHAHGWAVRPGEVFRIGTGPGIRVTVSRLEPVDAERFAEHLSGLLSAAGRTSAA
jgi:DNA-binding transcriptional MocR family regulator